MKKTKKPLKDYRFARFINDVVKDSGPDDFFRNFPKDPALSFLPVKNQLEILSVLQAVEPLCESMHSYAATFLEPEKADEVFTPQRLLAVVLELREFHRASSELNARFDAACAHPMPSHSCCLVLDKLKSQLLSMFFWLPALAALLEHAAAAPESKITLTTVFVMLTQGSTQTLSDCAMFLYSLEEAGLSCSRKEARPKPSSKR